MNKLAIAALLTAISIQSLAGDLKISFYAEKLNKSGGVHTEYLEPVYNGYPIIQDGYYLVDDNYIFQLGDDYNCCIENPINNKLKYFGIEHTTGDWSVRASTFEDSGSFRGYTASAYYSVYDVAGFNFKAGLSTDLNRSLEVRPSLVVSYDEYFLSPSIEVDKDNVSLIFSINL